MLLVKTKDNALKRACLLKSSTPPIGITREQPMLAQLFMNKYGIEIDHHHMNRSYFDCDKIE